MNLTQDIQQFIDSQLAGWSQVEQNYKALSAVITREIGFDGFHVLAQFNPERIRSSAAKVDAQSLKERKCFLCPDGRPEEQKGIFYPPCYTILVNPFPIFPRHLTIPDNQHTDQLIEGRIQDMLNLSQDLTDFVIFYNGPKCGASAPDHFHFQAGNKGFMPVEEDIRQSDWKVLIREDRDGKLFELKNYLRKTLVYESCDREWMIRKFEKYFELQRQMQPEEVEPMFNLLCWYENGKWVLVIFPRIKHRPAQFFEEGDNQILFSPGAVDFGGVLIFPRPEDFEKLSPELIKDMLGQLTFTDEMMNELIIKID